MPKVNISPSKGWQGLNTKAPRYTPAAPSSKQRDTMQKALSKEMKGNDTFGAPAKEQKTTKGAKTARYGK